MARKLCVNSSCIACNLCVNEAPNTFAIEEDRITNTSTSIVINQEGDPANKIQAAIDICPVIAISWEEEQ